MINIIWEKFYTEDKYVRMVIQPPKYAEEGIDSLIEYLDEEGFLVDSGKIVGGILPVYLLTFDSYKLSIANDWGILITVKQNIFKEMIAYLLEMGLPEDEQIAVVDCDEVANGYLH